MFGVGLHFDLDELLRVRRIALPGALWQCAPIDPDGYDALLMVRLSAMAALISESQ